MGIPDTVAAVVVGYAQAHNIDPAGLLAVVDIESDGKVLENDGKTPSLLFERHIFYRYLPAAKKQQGVSLGLANTSWQPSTQYKDQGTSSKRLALLARARALDEEAADNSCSWGVGQTMGFLHNELGYPSAKQMVDAMVNGGVAVQVACMVKEIQNKKIDRDLSSHNWADFAYHYNGAGYKQNAYDTKLASAYNKWKPSVTRLLAIAQVPQVAAPTTTAPTPPPRTAPAPTPALPIPTPPPAAPAPAEQDAKQQSGRGLLTDIAGFFEAASDELHNILHPGEKG